MELLAHTTKEAKRLGLGVDFTDGTGWPFGGPWVKPDDASSNIVLRSLDVPGGKRFTGKFNTAKTPDTLVAAVAFSPEGQQVDVTKNVADRTLTWDAPAGSWKVHAVFRTGPIMKVKRAAPGGAGDVLDPFSTAALGRYLGHFDQAFQKFDAPKPRAHFHDSFEYYGAQFTPALFDEFQKRRGYDLRTELPALAGEGDKDHVARVKTDFRETLGELHLDYVKTWTAWTHTHGGISRDQAHGAPANILDLYAAADIPETETFGTFDDNHMPMLKFASSAAHLNGRNLSSAESFTWLNNHFNVTLAEAKQAADYLFLTGANHLFFHGTPYSPREAAWPGWQFYAATNFGPEGGLWRDLPAFNAYLTRVQSVLQEGVPDNDVLLYFPLHDIWNNPEGLLMAFTVHNTQEWLWPHGFHKAAMSLMENGISYDHVSDAFLAQAKVENGKVLLGKQHYHAIVVPPIELMSDMGARELARLTSQGAKVIFQKQLPRDVPGFGRLAERRASFQTSLAELKAKATIGEDLTALATAAGVKPEPMAKNGLRFIRRATPEGFSYFIANRSKETFEGKVDLSRKGLLTVVDNPRFANRSAFSTESTLSTDSAVKKGIPLSLAPGESLVLKVLKQFPPESREIWHGPASPSPAQPLAATWKVSFIDGGPVLPKPLETKPLASWTTWDDPELKRFSGTALYSTTFEAPTGAALLLDLGKVCESVRIRLNGKDIATLFDAPYRVELYHIKNGPNLLELEVTNLAANRVADLDRRKVEWKIFKDINMAVHGAKAYTVFDASTWPLRDSGLLGPVTLTPIAP